MGCISSKRVGSPSPAFDSSLIKGGGFGVLGKVKEEEESAGEGKKSKSIKKGSFDKKGVSSLRFGGYTEAEKVAAGWPPWLTAVAGDAVDGWLPLRADLFEKLDKIGQGTYSSVYRARDVETGRIVALKKVRFDTLQPESVRFMAREIRILRRLDHPNIMKLEGLITSRLSCSIYLVFEYMEHDLSGLLSCPDIKFSDAQVKCYMRQLLAGLEHCHSRGVMHRDIKTSNILVSNDGILKIADFGLANYFNVRNQQVLTSRVVTLWYRPPELLLGSTNYGVSVDLWSVGCVFAELFNGKPILRGRTEVEQLHKIFKLCGSPPDDYWEKSKLPLATMFKPHHPYVSSLRERCKEFPKSAVILLETFLSVEPHKRGTASSALDSEYFTTKPYACDPSSLPRYPPNKEIDAKSREAALRRKTGGRARASGTSRNPRRDRKALQEPSSISNVVLTKDMEATTKFARRNKGGSAYALNAKGATKSLESMKSSYDTVSEASQTTEGSQVESIHSVPVVSASSGFAWAKKRKGNAKYTLDSEEQGNGEYSSKFHNVSGCNQSYEVAKHAMRRQQIRPYRPESFDISDFHQSQEFLVDYDDQKGRVQFSGPLLSQRHRVDEGQENHTRHSVHRSRFSRG